MIKINKATHKKQYNKSITNHHNIFFSLFLCTTSLNIFPVFLWSNLGFDGSIENNGLLNTALNL
jgi:hypothetical protein